jgi:2-methylaconitate cis-trans-isomerase PrpF
VEASVCDLANPCVFMAASSLGLRGDERPEAIEADSALIATVEEVRGRLGQGLGFWPDWRAGALPAMPMAVIVAAAPPDDPADIQARLLFLGHCHRTMAGTGAICLAAASRVPGTVVNRLLGTERAEAAVVRIGHPSGTLEVRLSLDHAGPGGTVRFRTLGFARTARRLMAGTVSIPRHSAGQAMAQPPAIDGAASN